MKENFIKYIDEKNDNPFQHWEYCKENHIPYVSLKNIGKEKTEIFYDVTELEVDLEQISEKVLDLFKTYKTFFLLDEYFGKNYEEDNYFFCFPVLSQHSECIAGQLFEFLLNEIDRNIIK